MILPVRHSISWFGYDLLDHSMIRRCDLDEWQNRVEQLAIRMDWQVTRFPHALDLVVEPIGGNITAYSFYEFQQKWEQLNEHFRLRMSGCLWLQNGFSRPRNSPLPCEIYRLGRKILGDSIGRPQRHSLAAVRVKPTKRR